MYPDKLYYSIGEVAKMYNVKNSLIRFWEKEFGVIHQHKNNKGNRLFTKKDLEIFAKIYQLVKVQGYTLEGAKKVLKLKQDIIISPPLEKSTNTSEIRDKLIEIRDKLK